ncbi:MAG: T9SS type A sorting domain-containing protein [Crocinitomix sp.]|nr:T9SS type A sorting domain-containing protein [Crocinitomix sp.]
MYYIKSCFIILGLAFSHYSQATNYYVSNSGDNENDGLSLVDAFLTIHFTVAIVAAGDTVFVEDGDYAGFDLREVSGTSENPIVYKTLGESAVIISSGPIRDDGINVEEANYIIIDGFTVNDMLGSGNGIRVVVANNCIVRNCYCDGNAERGIFTGFTDDILIEHNICTNSLDEHGIYVSNSSDRPIIRFNECYGNNGAGIHMNGDLSAGGDGIISDAILYGNTLSDNNGAAGINLDGIENPIIYNNLIYNNHSCQGIALFQQDGAIVTSGAKIFNNTIIVPEDGRWGILVKDGANVGTIIYNNIIINQHTWRGCIALEDTDGFSSDFNILNDKMSDDGDGSTISLTEWQALGFDENSELADDLNLIFVGAELDNFHLIEASQCIDAGTTLVADVVDNDLDSNPRPIGPAFDIGCYEYAAELSLENGQDIHISIYPNPATDFIKIDYDHSTVIIETIELINLSGSVVRTFESENLLDVKTIPAGIYLIRMGVNTNSVIYKKVTIY